MSCLQRSSELIDVQSLPLNDYTSHNATHRSSRAAAVAVRQLPMYELSKPPPSTPHARSTLHGGSARLQRRTSGKMQRPVAYLQQSSESFRARADSVESSSSARQRNEPGLLRLRKTSIEQPPPTPNSRSSTFVSQINFKPQSRAEVRLRRKHSVSGGVPDRLSTPLQEREQAMVRRHTSLSPRTLNQMKATASAHVTQRLVIDSAHENSDLLIISSSNARTNAGSASGQSSGQAVNSSSHWISTESFSSSSGEQCKPSPSRGGGGGSALLAFNRQHRTSPGDGTPTRDERCVIDVMLHAGYQSTDDEMKSQQQQVAMAGDVQNEQVASQDSNLTLSSVRLSMADFEPVPADTGAAIRPRVSKYEASFSVAQKTLHR